MTGVQTCALPIWEGHDRIRFVTEGEASFNFCVNNGMSGDAMKVGNHVVVVDAGGGTIDISGYAIEGKNPLQVEEIFASECTFTSLF